MQDDNDLIRGGQGREADDLRRDAVTIFAVLVGIALVALILAALS